MKKIIKNQFLIGLEKLLNTHDLFERFKLFISKRTSLPGGNKTNR